MATLAFSAFAFTRAITNIHLQVKSNKEFSISLQNSLKLLEPIIQEIQNGKLDDLNYSLKRLVEIKIDKIIRFLLKRFRRNYIYRMFTMASECNKLQNIVHDLMLNLQTLQIRQLNTIIANLSDLPQKISEGLKDSLIILLNEKVKSITTMIEDSKKEIIQEIQLNLNQTRSSNSSDLLIQMIFPYLKLEKNLTMFWERFPLRKNLTFKEFFLEIINVFYRKYNLSEEDIKKIRLSLLKFFREKENLVDAEINEFITNFMNSEFSMNELANNYNTIPNMQSSNYQLNFRVLYIPESDPRNNLDVGNLIRVSQINANHEVISINREIIPSQRISRNNSISVEYHDNQGYFIFDENNNNLSILIDSELDLMAGTCFYLCAGDQRFDFEILETYIQPVHQLYSEDTIEAIVERRNKIKIRCTLPNGEYNQQIIEIYNSEYIELGPDDRSVSSTILSSHRSLFQFVVVNSSWKLLNLERKDLKTWYDLSKTSKISTLQKKFLLHSFTVFSVKLLVFQVELTP